MNHLLMGRYEGEMIPSIWVFEWDRRMLDMCAQRTLVPLPALKGAHIQTFFPTGATLGLSSFYSLISWWSINNGIWRLSYNMSYRRATLLVHFPPLPVSTICRIFCSIVGSAGYSTCNRQVHVRDNDAGSVTAGSTVEHRLLLEVSLANEDEEELVPTLHWESSTSWLTVFVMDRTNRHATKEGNLKGSPVTWGPVLLNIRTKLFFCALHE